MSHRDFTKVQLMWKPDKDSGKTLKKLQKIIKDKYNVKIGNRLDFNKWSVEHLSEFWFEFWDFTGIICSRKFNKVIDLNVPMCDSPEWFPGARLNLAENMLRFKDDRIALISAGEDKAPEYITFAQMNDNVRSYAAAFRKFGLKKGDVVACCISNRAEAVFAMNATVSIGAIWTGGLPLLGAQAVLNRFKQVKPKILLTVDRFKNNNEEVEMLHKIKEVVNALHSVEKVIIVPSKPESKLKDISGIRGSCFLDEFLKSGRSEDGTIPTMIFEQVSFSHPVYITFTSGTTGLPKAIVHGCGALIPSANNLWLQLDCDRDSLWLSTFEVGWVSWNIMVSLSFCGISLLLFEGVPFYLGPTYLWDLIDEFGCTHMLLAPSVLVELEKRDYLPSQKNHLKSLKVCVTGGSVVTPQIFDFMYRKVKSNILFSSTYGATEVFGIVLSTDPTMAVYRGEIPVKCLGLDFQCVDETGKPVEGNVGELIISQPYPALPIGIWDDPDRIQYKNYFQAFPGMFAMKDSAIVNPVTKGFVICGRSDEALNQRNQRFGSSEIYNVVETFPEILDSICTAQYNKELGERAILFLKLRDGLELDENLLQRIRYKIASELTPAHVPGLITATEDIPYSVNGKKLEMIVKNIINNRPYNSESVANPECLKNFINTILT